MRRLGFGPGASRLTKPVIPTAPPVTPPSAPISVVGAGVLRLLGVGAADDFPNAPVGWTTVTDIAWAGTTLPYWPGDYEGDGGSHLIDYGANWYDARLTAPISVGATALTVDAPADTTVNGAHAIGAVYLKVASNAGWYQTNTRRFLLAGHEYAVAFTDTGDGPRIRLSRPLQTALTGGEPVAFINPFTVGASIQIGADPYEVKTIATVPDRFTLTWSGGLTHAYPLNTYVSRNYRRLATVEVDSTYPGSNKNVMRQRLPAGFPGGSGSANVQRHPAYAGNGPLRWAAGMSHGSLFVGVMVRVTPGFSLNGNVGNKVIYLRSSVNPTINHMILYLANDGGTGDQGYPTLAPQNPSGLGAYGAPQIAANDGHQGGWHRYEILLGPGTPGAANGTAKLWMDGRLLIDRADCRWFESGQTPDFDQLIIANVYGGGLNFSPQDQSTYIGRVFASVS